jgi:hypothetical protein
MKMHECFAAAQGCKLPDYKITKLLNPLCVSVVGKG